MPCWSRTGRSRTSLKLPCDGADLVLHPGEVRSSVQLATPAEDDPVLRVEPDEFYLLAQACGGHGEDFVEHPRIEEKSRAEIEPEAVSLDRRRPPPDDRHSLQEFDSNTSAREQDG